MDRMRVSHGHNKSQCVCLNNAECVLRNKQEAITRDCVIVQDVPLIIHNAALLLP